MTGDRPPLEPIRVSYERLHAQRQAALDALDEIAATAPQYVTRDLVVEQLRAALGSSPNERVRGIELHYSPLDAARAPGGQLGSIHVDPPPPTVVPLPLGGRCPSCGAPR